MARYKDAVCRLCRREGVKLFLKGDRCYSAKCGLTRRNGPPGPNKPSRRRVSEYGLQLREKQKARRSYGVLEKQFHGYFVEAERRRGVTGDNLFTLLESRFDNVVYRAGFAASRAQARQMVNHGHFTLNGKKANIPSILVKAGDIIAVRETSRSVECFGRAREGSNTVPTWLSVAPEQLAITIVRVPTGEDIDNGFEKQLIVELYSR